jgi:cytoskeletal protein CcmA (bactofilin family)
MVGMRVNARTKAALNLEEYLAQSGFPVMGHLRNAQVYVHAAEAVMSILVISDSASITGSITADHIIINGVVNGAVHAKMLLELQPKARIRGDVFYGALEMHEGALIDGRLTPMLPEEKHALKLAANNA